MQYLPVIKALRGQAAELEIGDVSRPAVESVIGMIWDVFFNDSILLMITFRDDNIEVAPVPVAQGQPVPNKKYEVVREFYFKWIRVANIISIKTDASVKINRNLRQFKPIKNEPLYTDELVQWHVLNNAVCRHIINKLKELKLEGAFPGAFRNEQNDLVSFADAFAPPAPVQAAPVPAPGV